MCCDCGCQPPAVPVTPGHSWPQPEPLLCDLPAVPDKRFKWHQWPGDTLPTELYSDVDLAVHVVLKRWSRALRDGTHTSRRPSPLYRRPDGKQPWTDDQLERIVKVAIDEYVGDSSQTNWARGAHDIKAVDGPGFDRLARPQREALAQDLERAFARPWEFLGDREILRFDRGKKAGLPD